MSRSTKFIRNFVVEIARELRARKGGVPTCVICGRGPAHTGWMIDSAGMVYGRCEGCIDTVERLK
jgi:hypothetical protein